MAPKILFVLSSHGKMGDTGKPTGWYLPEFAHPYHVLSKVADITIASPNGGAAPLDPSSVEAAKDEVSVEFLNTQSALWKNTVKLSTILGHASEYEAVFYVGGHGPMFDIAKDETSHKLIQEFYDAKKVVSAVCHGPAAFAFVKTSSGEYLVKDQPVTGFTNSEEDAVQLSSVMPFMLETQLKTAGGKFEKAADWSPNVVSGHGGRLITGQNPASASPIGEAIKKQLGL